MIFSLMSPIIFLKNTVVSDVKDISFNTVDLDAISTPPNINYKPFFPFSHIYKVILKIMNYKRVVKQ